MFFYITGACQNTYTMRQYYCITHNYVLEAKPVNDGSGVLMIRDCDDIIRDNSGDYVIDDFKTGLKERFQEMLG